MTPYEHAREELGTWEWKAGSNPVIDEYFDEVGHDQPDDTPWCAAFVGAMLKRAGLSHTGKLNARSYESWGEAIDRPRKGDIAVLWRGDPNGWQGHVAFVSRLEGDRLTLLGGNQSDQVNETVYPVGRVLSYRKVPGGGEKAEPPQTPSQPGMGGIGWLVAGVVAILAAILGFGG